MNDQAAYERMFLKIVRMRKKRDRKRGMLEIIAAILETSMTETTKTEIVYSCNLNFTIINYYLQLLLGNNLLAISSRTNTFTTTEKGTRYLQHYEELSRCLDLSVSLRN
jgi:predicted transcriptional regulator